MMHMRAASLGVIAFLIGCLNAAAADPAAQISTELSAQEQAWNRGDTAAFVTAYAVNCTFVGKQILRGRAQLLARYRRLYSSPEAMGKLSFSNLAIEALDSHIAIATGNWHIDRSSSAGGPVGGIFSLVWQFQNGQWRIVLDHTTQLERIPEVSH
jgi:uncharacterized protein (TIGR02246 family)